MAEGQAVLAVSFKGSREGSNLMVSMALVLPCKVNEFVQFMDSAKKYLGLGADTSVEITSGLSVTYSRGKDGKPGYFTSQKIQTMRGRTTTIEYTPLPEAEEGSIEYVYGPVMDAISDHFMHITEEELFLSKGEVSSAE